MGSVRIVHADCTVAMRELTARSIDACVTDPPYHLVSIYRRFAKQARNGATVGKHAYGRHAKGFMGKQWDGGDVAFQPGTWRLVWEALKPGAHLIAFGGTRTYHRMACAIEDAGFEIRDQIAWLYGSGFPKSHNAGNGWGTALKPALEPIVLARKPLIGTVAANVLQHGTGAINIDGCRVGTDEQLDGGKTRAGYAGCNDGWRRPFQDDADYMVERAEIERQKVAKAESLGRWPANVIHDGSAEVLDAFPAELVSGKPAGVKAGGQGHAYGHFNGGIPVTGFGDAGNAARFFYSAKADEADRLGSKHPTVKPVDLIAYLCRLITPPGGIVLDPFAGSGTTGMACMREGFNAILIEREAEYVADIRRRLDHVSGADTPLFAEVAAQ